MEIDKKFSYIKFFVLLIISLLIWKAIDGIQFIETILKVSKPFLYAFIIAFFLNSVKYIGKEFKLKRWANINSIYYILWHYSLFITIITPKIIESVKNLAKELPYYVAKTKEWLLEPSLFKGNR